MAEAKKKAEDTSLDTKVTVKSIAGWETGFSRKADGVGDVQIAPQGSMRLSRNEIIAQVQSGNLLFSGTDGMGSHATIYIDDEFTRRELGFEEDGRKQIILTDDSIKDLFAIKTQKAFENTVKDIVSTRAEKYAVMQTIKRLKLNDYSKIRYLENYTGYRMD